MMERNFSWQLIQQCEKKPDLSIIHLFLDREFHSISYRSLLTGASAYQRSLHERGIGLNDVVIIILPHGTDLIYAYFGCVLNGSIPSIMPYLTEKLIPEKYRQDLESLFMITHPHGVITFKDFSEEIEHLHRVDVSTKEILYIEDIGPQSENEEEETRNFPGEIRLPTDVALLQHSSGTTGLQKGVALSHQAIFNQLTSYAKALQINPNDVIVSWLPLYHDMGLIAGFLMPIFLGIPLILMSPFDWVRAPYLLMQAISKFKGTLCWLPNFAYNFCAKKIKPRDLQDVDLSSLRAVINCSEPMRKSSHDMFIETFEPYGFKPGAIATSYAMAENVFAVTQGGISHPVRYDEVDLHSFQEENYAKPAEPQNQTVTMVSAGRPIDNVQIQIIDEKGNALDERKIGEVVLKSDCMLSGYYQRDDATKEAFINGWFKTGDFGYIADDELFITGRKKDLIIVGGKNIYPKDIETIVMEIEGVHPGRVVAFGLFNDEKGTEDVIVIAEIDDQFLDLKEDIAGEIRKKVTNESAIALRNVLLVERKWLIKTSSGKIARALNKKKYIDMIGQFE